MVAIMVLSSAMVGNIYLNRKRNEGASQTYDTPSFFYQYDSGDAKQLLFNMFFCLSTHFYFSLPTEKFLRGQGEKYTRAEKGIDNYHLTEIYIAYSLSTNDLFTTRISDR